MNGIGDNGIRRIREDFWCPVMPELISGMGNENMHPCNFHIVVLSRFMKIKYFPNGKENR